MVSRWKYQISQTVIWDKQGMVPKGIELVMIVQHAHNMGNLNQANNLSWENPAPTLNAVTSIYTNLRNLTKQNFSVTCRSVGVMESLYLFDQLCTHNLQWYTKY